MEVLEEALEELSSSLRREDEADIDDGVEEAEAEEGDAWRRDMLGSWRVDLLVAGSAAWGSSSPARRSSCPSSGSDMRSSPSPCSGSWSRLLDSSCKVSFFRASCSLV